MEDVFKEWRAQLKSKQKKRAYKHFDSIIDLNNEKDFGYVVDKLRHITKHQFLPLVKFIKKDVRYRRDKNNKPKRTRKERPIMYASHIDAHMYSFFAYQWAKNYEDFVEQKDIDANVLAYRSKKDGQRGKNNINFACDVFKHIQNTGNCSVIIADISKFFDTLNHKVLKDRITVILGRRLSDEEYKIFKSLTKFRYILNDSSKNKKHSAYAKFLSRLAKRLRRDDYSLAQAVYEIGRNGIIKENKLPIGIPQGSPMSGLLANMYMSEFDSEFIKLFPDILYRRYSDDIAVVCATPNVESVFSWMSTQVKKYALGINPAKVFIATFTETGGGKLICSDIRNGNGEKLGRKFIDYLGFEFDGHNVRIRGKTLQNAYRKADRKIKSFLLRQTSENPRNKHTTIKNVKEKSNAYIKNASNVMAKIGYGIDSQKSKLSGFIRKIKAIKNKRGCKN